MWSYIIPTLIGLVFAVAGLGLLKYDPLGLYHDK